MEALHIVSMTNRNHNAESVEDQDTVFTIGEKIIAEIAGEQLIAFMIDRKDNVENAEEQHCASMTSIKRCVEIAKAQSSSAVYLLLIIAVAYRIYRSWYKFNF